MNSKNMKSEIVMLYIAKIFVKVIRKTKDRREIRKYDVNFSSVLFFFMFSKIEKVKTQIVVKRQIMMRILRNANSKPIITS